MGALAASLSGHLPLLLTLLLLSLLPIPSNAHVRLMSFPLGATIRNAPGDTSDGAFSVAGPCGGANRWGQRRPSFVVRGQKICTRIQLNGGHKAVENKFRAIWLCDRPDQQQRFTQQASAVVPFVDGTDPLPDVGNMTVAAPLANEVWDGYTVCVEPRMDDTLDETGSINDIRRQCTLSILDQRNWGGCHDFYVVEPSWPQAAQAVVARPKFSLASVENRTLHMDLVGSERTYRISNCDASSGGKCCLEGHIIIRRNGYGSARLRGVSPTNCLDLNYYGFRDYHYTLKASPYSANTYYANIYLKIGKDRDKDTGRYYEVQNMSIVLRAEEGSTEGGSITIVNVGLSAPVVSDHTAVQHSSMQAGLDLKLAPYPVGEGNDFIYQWWFALSIVGGVLFLYLGIGICWNCVYRKRYCEHPHIHCCLVGFGCVARRPGKNQPEIEDEETAPVKKTTGYQIKLPPNWISAVDNSSSEVYYVNTETQETTWTRPQ